MRKLLALIVFVILPGLGLLWYKGAIEPVDAGAAIEKVVMIPKGASMGEIAALLEEQGFLKSAAAFKLFTRLHGAQNALQAGAFALKPSMTVAEIVEVLTNGRARAFSLTIPEGFTVSDIDALVAEKGLAEKGAIEDCARTCDFATFDFLPKLAGLADRGGILEGYLFPDTYEVDPSNFVPKFFLERMLGNFRARIADGLATELKASKRSLHDIVTMGSLIEKEAITDEERPVIAGILWKRFDEGMGLGVDAAVRYILEKPTGALTVADLNENSPYNLRKFRGLPPGPIANAGLASIQAALQPKDSPYWYYLHGTDGVIRYAVTNDEHNANKAKYLR